MFPSLVKVLMDRWRLATASLEDIARSPLKRPASSGLSAARTIIVPQLDTSVQPRSSREMLLYHYTIQKSPEIATETLGALSEGQEDSSALVQVSPPRGMFVPGGTDVNADLAVSSCSLVANRAQVEIDLLHDRVALLEDRVNTLSQTNRKLSNAKNRAEDLEEKLQNTVARLESENAQLNQQLEVVQEMLRNTQRKADEKACSHRDEMAREEVQHKRVLEHSMTSAKTKIVAMQSRYDSTIEKLRTELETAKAQHAVTQHTAKNSAKNASTKTSVKVILSVSAARVVPLRGACIDDSDLFVVVLSPVGAEIIRTPVADNTFTATWPAEKATVRLSADALKAMISASESGDASLRVQLWNFAQDESKLIGSAPVRISDIVTGGTRDIVLKIVNTIKEERGSVTLSVLIPTREQS